MQRKNKPKRSSNNGGSGSGYESNENNNNSTQNNYDDDKTKSSPRKPSSIAPASGGLSIGALTGHTSSLTLNSSNNNNNNNNSKPNTKKSIKSAVSIATVKRNNCGTQPFDKRWLNLDCCGLICAGLTYMLHMFGVYSFGWILLPPWFSVMDEDGYRELTIGCHIHRILFITIASLAVFAHYKAMTTDPGAVPPDANPLPTTENLDELDNLIKGESSPTKASAVNSIERMERGMERGGGEESVRSSGGMSSLMQEDCGIDELLDINNGGGANNSSNTNTNGLINTNNNNNTHTLPHAVATAATVGAVVVGAAGIAGVAAVAGAASLASSAAPRRVMGGAASSARGREGIAIPMRSSSNTQQPRGRRMCRRCQAFKPPRAHHCSICKRCIIKMDHHCPWVNNCVGIGNHKYFLLFIFYTSLSCFYSFSCIMYRFFHCLGQPAHHRGPRCVDHPTDLLPLVGLTVEALLFGLFTFCMMFDQWDVVMTNLTHIDRLKGETSHYHSHGGHHNHGQQQHQHAGAYGKLPQHYNQHVGPTRNLVNNMRAGINEVFGTRRRDTTSSSPSTVLPTSSRFHYTWLSPLHQVCFPETVRNDIFGYCRPCSSGASSSSAAAAGGAIVEGARRINSMEMVGRGNNGRGGIDSAEIV